MRAEFTTPDNLAAQVIADLGRGLPPESPPGTQDYNRRVMLEHVESFWVKGILQKSLHGVALLELGIKENLDALDYPWAIKRESTKETWVHL